MLIALAFVLVQPPAAWPFDEFTHANGALFRGMILSENADGIRFQVVTRKPGRPTVTLTTLFTPAEVGTIKRISPADRALLKARLAELDPTGRGERARMEAIAFEPAEWLGKPDAARKYSSDHFVLATDAGDEIGRRAAVRLEQMFAALTRYLPPAKPRDAPTTVYLCAKPEAYRQLLGATPVLNPAIFDPAKNRIVCGSNLVALGDRLTGTRLHHQRQYQALDEYEASVRKLYRDQKVDLDRFLAAVAAERKRVALAEVANDAAFDAATKRLFAVLYHEAFHAYAHATGRSLPRWLDEGLAQLFETAVIDAGELHVDVPDAARLKAYAKSPPPVRDALTAKADDFLAKHALDRAASERAYLASWATAYGVLVATPSLDGPAFAAFLESKADPVAAFEAWVGMSCDDWDKSLRKRLSAAGPSTPRAP
jgi:hypothetical protein